MATVGAPPRFTDQQARAVTARGVSVALSAGAGCGKTFVLTERFLACLEPGGEQLRLDQLTAITFTERAAREMRQRIRAACVQRLLSAPEEHVDHWLRTIRSLESARISTIHSFCGALLRANAVEAQLDPQFAVLEQVQTDTLLHELMDQELRDRLIARDEPVMALSARFGLTTLREMIRYLLTRRQDIAWDAWRDESAEGLAGRWYEHWKNETLPRRLARLAECPAARRLLAVLADCEPTHAVMRERCDVLRAILPQLDQQKDPAAALALLRDAARVQGGGTKKNWPSENAYNEFREAAEELRAEIKKAEATVAFEPEAATTAAEVSLAVLRVAESVAAAFDRRKQELAVLDFNDLLIRARDLLVGPQRAALRKRLAAQTRLLLVDEFQDTDPLQVELVRSLCDGEVTTGRLFFVGDFKQSIYRFRGANPHVFRRLRDEMPDGGRLPLSLNFRSQPAILAMVNALFGDEMGPDYEPLSPQRPQVSPTPAVELLWAVESQADESAAIEEDSVDTAESGESRGRTSVDELRRREADWIARRVRGMLDNGEQIVWDAEAAKRGQPATRAVRPGDVALLFRALTDVEHYEEALRRYGINYYLVGGHAFYAQQEIYDVVNLLRSLVSPSDVVSLIGTLRSPMFGLYDETLFWLAEHRDGLAAALMAQRDNGGADLPAAVSAEQRRRVAAAARTLTDLRAMKDRVPIARLLQEAMARTGYDAVLLAEFLGERKLANLHKLIEQARAMDASGIFTLADYVTQLAQFVAQQPDEPLAATQPEMIDAVRLMTIHQSKGLEFPVVVVPDIDRPRMVRGGPIAFSPELGPMVRVSDTTSGYDLHREAESEEDLAETTRLLYVATTRAADYLILSAGVDELGKARGPWAELVCRHFDPASGKPLVDGAAGVEVRVTTTSPPLSKRWLESRPWHDLEKIVEKVGKIAAGGKGRVPEHLGPVPVDAAARRHYSFSRLTGALHPRRSESWTLVGEEGAASPQPAAIDPRGLGTLVHAVLAQWMARRQQPRPKDDELAALVQQHAGRHLSDECQPLDEPIEMLRRFGASERWSAIAAADEAHAELEFLLAWPPGSHEEGSPYLQGFLDCLYRDAAGWHVVDYKTNRVAPGRMAAVAADYELQMFVYGLAVEQIIGQPPCELVLHFLRTGEECAFTWNDAARQRAVEMVDRAMAACANASIPAPSPGLITKR